MFEEIDKEEFEIKLTIAGTAARIYVENGGSFTFKEIAKRLEVPPASLFDYFDSKKTILEFYYRSLVIRYHLMITEIDDFQSYSLSEKLSNFIYASFDMLEEQESFVRATFVSTIRQCHTKTEYEQLVEETFKNFFQNDEHLSMSSSLLLRSPFFVILRISYLQLVTFWLDDESEGREQTMELTDKLASFLQELMYSSVADKGLELLKFMVSNDIITRNIPFWDAFSAKIEIRS
jgi:AcrR family transcriptional regulator